jgi:hypothetical protein
MRMRLVLLMLACLMIFPKSQLSAQDPEVGATYRVDGRLVPIALDAAGALTVRGDASTLNPLVVYLGDMSPGGVRHAKFQFVPYTKNDALNTKWVGDENNPKIFAVPFTEFSGKIIRAYATGFSSGEVVVGALALPAKLRVDPFNFSGSISLGPSLAWRWRVSATREYHMGLIASVGTSSVQLTTANTDSVVTEATDRAAYYFAAGVMAEYGSTQVGFFLGTDLINDPNQEDWIYQGKPWFSIGIGATIFGARADRSAPTEQKPRL